MQTIFGAQDKREKTVEEISSTAKKLFYFLNGCFFI